jgi:hypothetical protein
MIRPAFLHSAAAMAVLLMLCGCMSSADRALRNSPDFKAGYSDGCASAGTEGANPRDTGYVRDEESYRVNKAYHAGWGTGFNACRNYQPSGNAPPPPGQGPIPDPMSRRF